MLYLRDDEKYKWKGTHSGGGEEKRNELTSIGMSYKINRVLFIFLERYYQINTEFHFIEFKS